MDNNLLVRFWNSKIRYVNKHFLLLITITVSYGILVLYSAAGGAFNPWAYKQILNILISMPLLIIIAFTDIRIIYKSAWTLYIIILLMLIAVEIIGYTAKGGTRWLNLGGFKLQPSELAKISIIIMLARCFHNMAEAKNDNLPNILLTLIALIIPVMLIIKQPDLGTGIIIIMIALCMFFAIGVNIKNFVFLFAGLIIALPILWNFLRDYQKQRILVFLNPERDPLGTGYNILQSKISLGSGGIFGKGIGNGTQSQLEFLPEHQTDFIFASLCEDFGMIGGLTLITLYALIIYATIAISINSKTIFGKMLAIGVVGMFFAHIFVNIAMVMGLVPVVGVPLPLISYGGTMMMSMLAGFALIMNVHIHQSTHITRNHTI